MNDETKNGILYVVSGPSGAGKSSIIKKALQSVQGFSYSVSFTTRPVRPDEADGIDEIIEKNDFLEWANVHGYRYGTSKSHVEKKLDDGYNIILDVDVQGAVNIKNVLPERTVTIFVAPPSYDDLSKRLSQRATENERDLKKRLEDAKAELAKIPYFDYLIVNSVLAESISQLISIIIAEQLKVKRVAEHLGQYTFFRNNP
jgi:guanylate kinase